MFEFMVISILLYIAYHVAKSNNDDWFRFQYMIDKLMIVAHPDDEALFGGAELLTHSKEYKVIVKEK